jgi:hypothetical protein
MKWLTKGWFLKEQQLGLYFDSYCLQRLSPTLDDSHLIEYKEKPLEPIAMLPFWNVVLTCHSMNAMTSSNRYNCTPALERIV